MEVINMDKLLLMRTMNRYEKLVEPAIPKSVFEALAKALDKIEQLERNLQLMKQSIKGD